MSKLKQVKEKIVEVLEIWIPTDNPKEAMATKFPDGQSMKRIASLANNVPMFLEDKCVLEKRYLTEEEYNLLVKK